MPNVSESLGLTSVLPSVVDNETTVNAGSGQPFLVSVDEPSADLPNFLHASEFGGEGQTSIGKWLIGKVKYLD